MNSLEEGIQFIEESCGNGKDNVIALSTIALQPSAKGNPYSMVREVDAYYENGVFYITTSAQSNKMMQVQKNEEVSFAVCFEGISGHGIAENLGWVLDPKNTEIRTKLRKTFADWYDQANDEQNQNCVILAIHISTATIFRDHGAICYHVVFDTPNLQ